MTNHCKICDQMGHTAFYCPKKPRGLSPKKYKTIKNNGKYYKKWLATKKAWFKENGADNYTCYLCGRYLTLEQTSLDHVKPRSGNPELRYEFSNLKPCCWECNSKKGSKRYDND